MNKTSLSPTLSKGEWKKKRKVILSTFLFFIALILIYCNSPEEKKTTSSSTPTTYLNLNDTAKYVGKEQCRLCHQNIYNSFIETGMGKSFDVASKTKSAARFSEHEVIYDKQSDFYYHPYWSGDSLKVLEFRIDGKDTVYKRLETIKYIIGSGQHTNSHIISVNNYLHQAPATFYTQKAEWDLPPGFENGNNTRFSRKIGLECMSCHNAYPDFVEGSENKYSNIPNGVNCERCHGPGSIHVQQKSLGMLVDTSKKIDYSIVNPAKLPIDLQFDVCQRCHLQGNAVLKEGKSFFDFKPGMKLSDVMTVFLPRYENADKDFIMASHADRLKQSQCFIKSFKSPANTNSLKPYKQSLTCVTCHNPHVSVKVTGKEVFNNACKNCHGKESHQIVCTEKETIRKQKMDNCVSCHMPKSGSIDIPHVTITDHYIRKPVSKQDVEKIKKFIGLYAINEKNPSSVIKAKAYINQYEKFEPNKIYLDSALKLLGDTDKENIRKNLKEFVRIYFLKENNDKVVQYVSLFDIGDLLNNILDHRSLDNEDAWACYRIGQAYQYKTNNNLAYTFYKKACELAPAIPDFKNKLATVLLTLNKGKEAKIILEEIIKEAPEYAIAYCNLGYLQLLLNNSKEAEINYKKALALDPDYEQALLNISALYIYFGSKEDHNKAEVFLKKVLKKNPESKAAKELLAQLTKASP